MEPTCTTPVVNADNFKYCVHCGAQIYREAVICVKCGRSVEQEKSAAKVKAADDTMPTLVKIFLILGCISQGWLIFPLAWCIPITVSVFNRLKNHQPIGTGLKVCTMLFVSLISGICLLCMNENNEI